jgi:glycosyltransferase involved in cell wall biosynthesis
VLSHSGWLGKDALIPTIGWIPDFQHIHLPEFFSKKEISIRNKHFHDLCRYCSTVIVSSFHAQTDLCRFAPDCRDKSEVLRFAAASIKPEMPLPSRTELEERYKFSGNYFLLPNQFWKHKNHLVVIEALGLLIREDKQVLVLATGNTEDYRHPQYFASLMSHAKDLAVLNNFRPLGLVPAHDLAALMRYATAIINPSFFEGWSTTVEESKSLGKRILLSDISVHREQNPPLAHFFSPNDAAVLAATLWDVWNSPAQDDAKVIERARFAADERQLDFAKKYQHIVFKTVEK